MVFGMATVKEIMTIRELVEKADLLEYVSQFAEFEERGGEYWCLSPLKEENTPSFSIRKETNQWWDFSTSSGGDILDFIKAHRHCSTGKAVAILKSYLGYEGELTSDKPKSVMSEVAKRFSAKKRAPKQNKTTVLPQDYMDRYENNPGKLQIWVDEGIKTEILRKYQVKYDAFSDRIVFPIRDHAGNIVNVKGRALDPDFKAKGLPKYTYFKPLGSTDIIFGWSENMEGIQKFRQIILFEGEKSVMKADGWGIPCCGAIMTSHLNENQMKALARLGCTVVFALDKEIDVHHDENIRRLSRYVPIEYIHDSENLLEPKMAPVDAGFETFKKLYERRRSYP